jgi:uncharacterized protein
MELSVASVRGGEDGHFGGAVKPKLLNPRSPIGDQTMLTFRCIFRRIFLTAFFLNGTVVAVAQSPGGESRGSAVSLIPRGREQPSFDCEKAKSAAARLICADGELARLDGELGDVFRRQKALIPAADQSKFVASQIAWIRKRNENCALKGKDAAAVEALADLKPCIASALRERIGVLTSGDASGAPSQGLEAGHEFVAEMSATATQTNPPRITGTTNLPAGTKLSVTVVRTGYGPSCPVPTPRGVCWIFEEVVVQDGRFTASMGSPLPSIPPGSYTIEIRSGISQPEEVEAVIGKFGQRLRGRYVGLERDHKPESLRQFFTRTDLFEVYYTMAIQIVAPQVTGVAVVPKGSKEKWQQVEGLSANGSGRDVAAIDLSSIRRDSSDAEAAKLGFTSPKISDGRPRMASATICRGDCTEKNWMRYDCYGKYDNWSAGLTISVRPTSTAGLIATIACAAVQE